MPVDVDSEGHVVSRLRTAKAMRSALAGVPIVSPAWIQACGEKNEAVVPSSNLLARSLPTKTEAMAKSNEAKFGIAKLTAYPVKKVPMPLHNMFVLLCGAFSENKRKNLQLLSKEAGAKVLTTPAAASAKLGKARVVFVCDETTSGSVIPTTLIKEAQKAVEHDPSGVLVVNPNWVFDSITCAKSMPADSFAPLNAKAKELWKLCQTCNTAT